MENKKVNIVICGDSGTGKSCYLKRLMFGYFKSKHTRTLKIKVRPLVFQTNYGNIYFMVYEISGKKNFEKYVNKESINTSGAIIMCSNDIEKSFNTFKYYKKLYQKTPNIIVIINKCDLPQNRRIKKIKNDRLFRISVKKKIALEDPLVKMAKLLYKREDLYFVN
jgi:GTPase SAR1 family protein